MSFRGVTFNKQICKSEDDALIFHTFLNAACGRVRGCSVTYDSENIYLNTGYFMTYGRLVNVYGKETLTPETVATGTQYNRLVFTIDLSLENTAQEFNQGYFEFLSSYDGYPSPVQEDLFDGGYVYQLPICKFELTVNGIRAFADEMGSVNISEVWGNLEDTINTYRREFELLFDESRDDFEKLFTEKTVEFEDWFREQEQIILQMIEDLKDQDFVTNEKFNQAFEDMNKYIFNGEINSVLLSSDDEPVLDRDYNPLVAERYIQFK